MKRCLILIALMSALALGACETMAAPPSAKTVRITLSRSPCFGSCPDYTVTISGDGQVTYVGRRFVGVTGEQHANASPGDVARLLAMFDRAHFFDLNDRYRAQITDLPTYEVTLERAGQRKTVEDYAGESVAMPHAVREIEIEIDRVAGTSRWVLRPEQGEAPK